MFCECWEEELSHYDMFSTVLPMLTIATSWASLVYLRSPPLFSAEQTDRVEAGLGEEAVLHCQVSFALAGDVDVFMRVVSSLSM